MTIDGSAEFVATQIIPSELEIEEPTQKLVRVGSIAPGKEDKQHGNSGFSLNLDLSVIVPTRNEHANIQPLLEALQNTLAGLHVEVIFVDDSDDDTPEIIKDAARTMGASRFHIQLEHRAAGVERAGGLATAVVHGMNVARAEYIAIMDADLQHPPEQLRVFYDLAAAEDVDLVIAT